MTIPAIPGVDGISIVIPFYNEEPNLEPLRHRLISSCEDVGLPFEVILVDDGSTDNGGNIARALAARDSRIRVLSIETRSGQSAALDVGFRAARHSTIITMDADLQNDPDDIPLLLERLAEADAVCGIRMTRNDNWVRRISSRIANRVRDRITGDHVTDTGCSLKAYRAEYLRRLKLYTGLHRFLPTLLRIEGARVVEVPVRHHPRAAGRSKYGIGNRALVGLRDCFAVRWMRDRHLRYRIKDF